MGLHRSKKSFSANRIAVGLFKIHIPASGLENCPLSLTECPFQLFRLAFIAPQKSFSISRFVIRLFKISSGLEILKATRVADRGRFQEVRWCSGVHPGACACSRPAARQLGSPATRQLGSPPGSLAGSPAARFRWKGGGNECKAEQLKRTLCQ